jgi:spermidine/putrescine transport system permease protein
MRDSDLLASRPVRGALGLVFVLSAFVIYLPLMVMMLFSVNSGRFQTLPFREPTLQWYLRIASDRGFADGLLNSLVVATGASLLATTIGFLAAYGFQKARLPGRPLLLGLVLAPLAVPLILIGIGMRLQITAIGLQPALWIVMLGQTVYVLPLAILNLRARIAKVPPSLEEAALSLGAGRLRAIFGIVAPACGSTLLATLLLTFTFAFDEFVIAYFLTNFEITLPIKIWTTLVTGFDPTINAVGTGVFLFSLTLGIAAQLFLVARRPNTAGGRPA